MRVKRPADATTTLAWRRRAAHRPREIAAAARALLEQRGYRGFSMARVAQRAGVSEATIYAYFRGRQELMNRVLTEWATPFVEELEQDIARVSGLRAKVELIARRYLRSMQKTPRMHRAFFQEIRWGDYHGTPLYRLNQRYARMLTEAVREAVAAGEAAPSTSAAALRDILFGGLEHVAQRTIFAGRPAGIEAEAIGVATLILDGAVRRRRAGIRAPRTSAIEPPPHHSKRTRQT